MSVLRPREPLGRSAKGTACLRHALETACLAIALMCLPGCSRDAPPATVEGTLRLQGRPLDNCLVSFLPAAGQDAKGFHSAGLTDQRGLFRLRRDDQTEGAAVGPHRVTVQDLSVSTGVRRRDHGTVDADAKDSGPPPPARRSRVPQRYLSPADTPLRVEVKPGHQVIDLEMR